MLLCRHVDTIGGKGAAYLIAQKNKDSEEPKENGKKMNHLISSGQEMF